MRRTLVRLSAAIMLITIGANSLLAQFEQKLTLQGAGGWVEAREPELFKEIFHGGFSLDAGVQYNFSRSISMVVMVKYSNYLSVSFPNWQLTNSTYNLMGINLCPKYRFFSRSRVNPYIFGGAGINFISITFHYKDDDSRKTVFPASIGFTGGVGVDYRINDNIALFFQGGLNRVDLDLVWLDSHFTQLGVNINMFKARAL